MDTQNITDWLRSGIFQDSDGVAKGNMNKIKVNFHMRTNFFGCSGVVIFKREFVFQIILCQFIFKISKNRFFSDFSSAYINQFHSQLVNLLVFNKLKHSSN